MGVVAWNMNRAGSLVVKCKSLESVGQRSNSSSQTYCLTLGKSLGLVVLIQKTEVIEEASRLAGPGVAGMYPTRMACFNILTSRVALCTSFLIALTVRKNSVL